jgi:pimeloyl-ACP methyl ester carboxylesterase
MPGAAHTQRAGLVEQGFRSLPDRYLGAPAGFNATYQLRLGDLGQCWEVRLDSHGARVRRGASRRRPDVVLGTDAQTWLELREGELSGVDAFSQRRLYARGNLDLAVGFEGMFRRSGGRDPLLRIHDVPVGNLRLSTLTMGQGRDLLLIHGLGATKASFFDTAAALSTSYRVHAIDLPGFGSSSKPATAPYNAAFFADAILGAMDAMGIERVHVTGNSLGGRVAIEIALRAPGRVRGLGLLCPAVAFMRRGYHPLVRVLRPEFGLLPHAFGRERVARVFWDLFADADAIDPSVVDVVVDEFRRIYGSAGARLAFLASARNVYLERPDGPRGFYQRLSDLQPPALFVWGSHDRVIPNGFSRHVERALPGVEQIVIGGCGHVPQVERPAQTNGLLTRFFARTDALDAPARARAAA